MASLCATKASNLATRAFVLSRRQKKLKTKRIVLKSVNQHFVESVGFLRVLRFLPTSKVDRVVWVMKK